jgi:hypothetical protein
MVCTPRIEERLALGAHAAAAEIFTNGQLMASFPTQNNPGYGLFGLGPDLGWVIGERLVTTDAGVVVTITLVTDGDNVALGMPKGALRERADRNSVDVRAGGIGREDTGLSHVSEEEQ